MIRRRWLLALSLLALFLAFVVGAGLLQVARVSSLEDVAADLARLTPYATAVRVTLIALVAIFWRQITGFIARRNGYDAERTAELQAWRWRLVGWLVLLELVIGQDTVNRFIEATR
jgi:hypothetical protein